jgi:NAD(P)-dependent dehydrogenase (short-subunit alcohol dehydrogenase family)
MEEPMTGTVFITGAGSGIGEATARLLVAKGYTVYAGVHSGKIDGVSCIALDVTDPASVADAALRVAADAPGGVRAVINNAGIIVQGPLELTRPEDLLQQFAVNTLGPAYVIQSFLPLLRAGHGRVINISAPTARVAFPFLPALSASKAALSSLSDALRLELAAWNIPVIEVSPGSTSTRIFAKADELEQSSLAAADPEVAALYSAQRAAARWALARQKPSPVEPVARTVLTAVTASSPKRRYPAGSGVRAGEFLGRLPAGLRERLIMRVLGLSR